MKQNTLKTIKSMLGKTISKTMNYSGWYDISLIFKTVKVMIKPDGAY